MPCTRLCKDLGFGSKNHIKGARHCLTCELFIITESVVCACCGSTLGYNFRSPNYKKSYSYGFGK